MTELTGIQLGTGFILQAEKPLDLRQQYDTIELMRSMPDSSLYEGIVAYVLENKKFYKFSLLNDKDVIYGRWREYEDDSSATKKSKISIIESTEEGVAKSYQFYQGPVLYNEAEDTYDYSTATKLGTINIPLDLVISDGYIANVYCDNENSYAFYYLHNDSYDRKIELDYEKYKFEKYLLVIHIANSDGQIIEIPLSIMIPDPYTAGNNITISDDLKISAVGFLKQTSEFLGITPGIYQYIGDDELLVYGGVYQVTDTDVKLLYPKPCDPCPEQYINEAYEVKAEVNNSYYLDFTECQNWDDLLNFGCPQRLELTENEYNELRSLYNQTANQVNYTVADTNKICIVDTSQAVLLKNVKGDTGSPDDLVVTFSLLNLVNGEYIETDATISCYIDPKVSIEETNNTVTFKNKFDEIDTKIELVTDERIPNADIIALFN